MNRALLTLCLSVMLTGCHSCRVGPWAEQSRDGKGVMQVSPGFQMKCKF